MIGLKWMERIEDETSGWSETLEIEKCVVFIDLHSRPAQARAVMHEESKVSAPETVEDTRLCHP